MPLKRAYIWKKQSFGSHPEHSVYSRSRHGSWSLEFGSTRMTAHSGFTSWLLSRGHLELEKQVFDDVLAPEEVAALQPLVREVAVVRGLPEGHQESWC